MKQLREIDRKDEFGDAAELVEAVVALGEVCDDKGGLRSARTNTNYLAALKRALGLSDACLQRA